MMVVKKDNTLVEQTQQNLLKYMVEHNYEFNSQLPTEQELADLLGVSRVVVREALSRLRVLGFIETKKKKGTVVVVPEVFGVLKVIVASGLLNKESLKDLYQLRLMLEIGMADFIFLNKTSADIKVLNTIVSKEEQLEESQDSREQNYATEELIALDIQFHSTLYAITGNKSLMDFQHLLGHLYALYTPRTKIYRARQIVSHAGLVNVLSRGTADAFRMAMRMHLNTQFDDMEQILAKVKKQQQTK